MSSIPATPGAQDRAHRLTTAICQVFITALRRWFAGERVVFREVVAEIEALAREEISDAERQVANDLRPD